MANPFLDILNAAQPKQLYTPNPSLMEQQRKVIDATMSPVAKSAAPAPEEINQISSLEKLVTGGSDTENKYLDLLKSLTPSESEGERKLREKILEEQKRNIEAQKASIQTQREIANLAMTQQPSTNLSPVLNLIDSWTGSNLSQGYTPPKSTQDVLSQAFTMRQKIADLEGDLTKNQTDFLKAQLQSMKESGGYDPIRLAREIDRSQASDERRAMAKDRFGQTLVEKVEKDQTVSKANQSIAAATNVKQLIESNNPLADNAIPTYLARASGEVGALSEADKRPFGGEQSLTARMKQAASMAVTGRMTPENREFVRQLADTMEQAAKRNINRRKLDLAQSYARAQKSFSKDEIEALLGVEKVQQNEVQSPQQPSGTMTFEQWKAARGQ